VNKTGYLIIVGILAAALLLSIIFLVVLVNHRPIITGLEAEPQGVVPRGTCQILCSATDPDGDELIYGWSANQGTIAVTESADSITWTAPSSTGSHNVTVIVTDGHGGATTESVAIKVRNNRAPTISSLTADADWTLPAGSLNLTCVASDLDGDELSYEWSSSGGDVSGTGADVKWTAPQETGVYDIAVVVTDPYGGSDTRTFRASVASEQPPIIQELNISAVCYLKPYAAGYYVGKGQPYDIECVVADPDVALTYEWSCDGGEFSGEGPSVVWTAPDATTYATITATVSDIAGNTASKSLFLNVVSCSTCTFGPCNAG
jgi:Bacterial Ig domain